jgi:hypothetical protein
MTRLRRVVLAAAALAALGGAAQPQPAVTLAFFQLDVDFDGDKHKKSQWGYVEMEYMGSSDTLYFNLAVEGFWRIRNMPVLSPEGPLAAHAMSFGFDLGVSEGTKVKFVSYAAELTDAPLEQMPQSLQVAPVHPRHYRLYTGFGGDPIGFTPPAPVQEGGVQDAPKYEHKGFPNQEAKKDECVPAAVSNSLQWLNEKYKLGIAQEQMTIEHMKVATDWDKDRPGCNDNWPQNKKEHLAADGIPVSTDTISALEFKKVEEAMKNGCDVEIGIDNHTAAVTAIQKLAPGGEAMDPDYSVVLTHDSDQKADGGLVNEPVTYDDDFLRFHGPAWVENKPVGFIVVECPITPTPTPSSTLTPSRTLTPSPTPTSTQPGPIATPTVTPEPTQPAPTRTPTP